MKDTAVLRNIQTDDLYRHIEGNNFKNIRTGVIGEVEPDLANTYLKINISATLILNKYPNIENLISKLQLKIIE